MDIDLLLEALALAFALGAALVGGAMALAVGRASIVGFVALLGSLLTGATPTGGSPPFAKRGWRFLLLLRVSGVLSLRPNRIRRIARTVSPPSPDPSRMRAERAQGSQMSYLRRPPRSECPYVLVPWYCKSLGLGRVTAMRYQRRLTTVCCVMVRKRHSVSTLGLEVPSGETS